MPPGTQTRTTNTTGIGLPNFSNEKFSDFIKQIFGGGNLMGEGQGMPTRQKQFDPSQDRTQRAIREINRIGDNTPKP